MFDKGGLCFKTGERRYIRFGPMIGWGRAIGWSFPCFKVVSDNNNSERILCSVRE